MWNRDEKMTQKRGLDQTTGFDSRQTDTAESVIHPLADWEKIMTGWP